MKSMNATGIVNRLCGGLLLVLLACAPAAGQTLPPVAKTADLSGPRFGLTLLSDGVVQELATRDISVRPHATPGRTPL